MSDDATSRTGSDGGMVRPIAVGFPQEAVDDMRRRVAATRWHIAQDWVELMHRLGYSEFVAQGGDWGAAVTQAYWENQGDFFDAKNISIPYAISVFPDELYQAPRSWAEQAYPENLIHSNRLDRGGHFAAWEQPQIFCEELRNALRSLR